MRRIWLGLCIGAFVIGAIAPAHSYGTIHRIVMTAQLGFGGCPVGGTADPTRCTTSNAYLAARSPSYSLPDVYLNGSETCQLTLERFIVGYGAGPCFVRGSDGGVGRFGATVESFPTDQPGCHAWEVVLDESRVASDLHFFALAYPFPPPEYTFRSATLTGFPFESVAGMDGYSVVASLVGVKTLDPGGFGDPTVTLVLFGTGIATGGCVAGHPTDGMVLALEGFGHLK